MLFELKTILHNGYGELQRAASLIFKQRFFELNTSPKGCGFKTFYKLEARGPIHLINIGMYKNLVPTGKP